MKRQKETYLQLLKNNLSKYFSGSDSEVHYILVQITDNSLMANFSEAVFIYIGEK